MLHETPFVDVADGIDGIDGDGDGWHSIGAYCTAKLTFSQFSCESLGCVLYSRFYGKHVNYSYSSIVFIHVRLFQYLNYYLMTCAAHSLQNIMHVKWLDTSTESINDLTP